MIEISLESRKAAGGCNACFQDPPKHKETYVISLKIDEKSYQSNSIRLCPDCMKELKNKMKGW